MSPPKKRKTTGEDSDISLRESDGNASDPEFEVDLLDLDTDQLEETLDTRMYGRVAKNQYNRFDWCVETKQRDQSKIALDPCLGVTGRNSFLFAAMCAPPYDERDDVARKQSKILGDHQDSTLKLMGGCNPLRTEDEKLTYLGGRLYSFFNLTAAVGICIGTVTDAEIAKRRRTFNKAIADGLPIRACRCIRSLQYRIKPYNATPGMFLIHPDSAEKLRDYAIQITCVY